MFFSFIAIVNILAICTQLVSAYPISHRSCNPYQKNRGGCFSSQSGMIIPPSVMPTSMENSAPPSSTGISLMPLPIDNSWMSMITTMAPVPLTPISPMGSVAPTETSLMPTETVTQTIIQTMPPITMTETQTLISISIETIATTDLITSTIMDTTTIYYPTTITESFYTTETTTITIPTPPETVTQSITLPCPSSTMTNMGAMTTMTSPMITPEGSIVPTQSESISPSYKQRNSHNNHRGYKNSYQYNNDYNDNDYPRSVYNRRSMPSSYY